MDSYSEEFLSRQALRAAEKRALENEVTKLRAWQVIHRAVLDVDAWKCVWGELRRTKALLLGDERTVRNSTSALCGSLERAAEVALESVLHALRCEEPGPDGAITVFERGLVPIWSSWQLSLESELSGIISEAKNHQGSVNGGHESEYEVMVQLLETIDQRGWLQPSSVQRLRKHCDKLMLEGNKASTFELARNCLEILRKYVEEKEVRLLCSRKV